MKYLAFLLLILTNLASAAETLSNSYDVTLKINVLKPACKLSTTKGSIDFGEVDRKTISTNQPEGSASFLFTDCQGVNNINISFSGNYIDSSKNQLINTKGEQYASGIAIKLYDSSAREIVLSEQKTFNVDGAGNYNLDLTAKVITEDGYDNKITTGLIKSSVTLVISYG